jgi:hypothetical protein
MYAQIPLQLLILVADMIKIFKAKNFLLFLINKMEKSQESWKKYWPWIIAAIGFIIIVIIMIYALKGNGGGGGSGPSNNPPKASLGTPTLKKAGDGTDPWKIITKYAIAYVDSNGNGTHDGKSDFCPNLHGALSNVVAVQSQTNTSPSFLVTMVDGYDVLVFRTQGNSETDTADKIADPVAKYSDCTTLTPGANKETLIATITSKTTPAASFIDNNNPYNGPPSIINLDYTNTMTLNDKKKIPFRNNTYYKVQLALGTINGTAGYSTTPAISATSYGPLISFNGTLDAGKQTFLGGYTINVFSSTTQGAAGTYTQLTVPVFTQVTPDPATGPPQISFVDLQNIQYTGPPSLSSITPVLTYGPTPASAQPWGYLTSYVLALSDYQIPVDLSTVGTATPSVVTVYAASQTAPSYPILTIPTGGPDLTGYSVIVFRTDNSATPGNAPVPPVPALPALDSVTGNIYSEKAANNPYQGIATTVYSTPTFSKTDLTNFPFKTPMIIQSTLTDVNNKWSLAATASPSFSDPIKTTPVFLLTLPYSKQTWANYLSPAALKVSNLNLTYTVQGSASPIPFKDSDVTLSIDTGNVTITLTILLNPYTGNAYPSSFQCNKWTAPTEADCDDTCNGPPTNPGYCCSGNKWQAPAVSTINNENGSCAGPLIQNMVATDFDSKCKTKSYQSNLIITKVDVDNKIYDGFCGSQCPSNWTLGNWGSPGTYPSVCSPVDASAPQQCSQWGNNFDNFTSTPTDCIGYGCEPLPSPSDGIKMCQADQDPNGQTAWTILNPPDSSATTCPADFPLPFNFQFSSNARSGNVPGPDYTLCSKWKN